MTLWAYALDTVARTKLAAQVATSDDGADSLVEQIVNEASEMVEAAWGRHLVSRGELTEYYIRDCRQLSPDLYPNQYPLVSVTDIYEDDGCEYPESTKLVVNTDYQVLTEPVSKIRRVSGGFDRNWSPIRRSIRMRYIGGFQNTTGSVSGAVEIPARVKRVFYELVGWIFRQRSSSEVGLQSTQDATGTRTFSGPAYVTPAMRAALLEAGACGPRRLVMGER